MRPVPHLAARAVPDRAALRRMLADLTAIGVEDMLLLAGSLATPVGEFHEAAQVLDSGHCSRRRASAGSGSSGTRRAIPTSPTTSCTGPW